MFLITGGNGFVGRPLTEEMALRGLSVRSASRMLPTAPTENINYTIAPRLGRDADWAVSLSGVSTIIHAAARVHAMGDQSGDALTEYRRVNVDGTLSLAEQAARAGVRRFVFLSSIKVNGEETKPGQPYTEADDPAPKDAYGQSKLEAELGLRDISNKTGMEIVILRPPMIYGPGVKGNFARLIKLAELGLPLPFGAVNNQRSMIGLKNCIDLIICAAIHEKASGNVFLMSDGYDLSTTELLKLMCKTMKRPSRLYPLPTSVLYFAAKCINQDAAAQRLLCSLQVDIGVTRKKLNWSPIQSIEDGLAVCF